MKTPPLSASAPSLNSSRRLETFDEKTHRFNCYEEIPTYYGRVFHVQEPRVITSFDFEWQAIYLAQMELIEHGEQYQLPFEVAIYWEEMFGCDRLPSPPTLLRMARTAIGTYLESHRIARGLSCHTHLIRLQIPDSRKPKIFIHPHNY